MADDGETFVALVSVDVSLCVVLLCAAVSKKSAAVCGFPILLALAAGMVCAFLGGWGGITQQSSGAHVAVSGLAGALPVLVVAGCCIYACASRRSEPTPSPSLLTVEQLRV